ncbi:MAG: signal peptide peptidase SppA [Wenzhouxiangellaceae bacterium]|nr:signal peptide peptidase SppA [Wenzhouxiangellaceae bacterium]
MTEPKKANFLLRLWRGFWNGLTAFRIAVFNIIFLFLLALLIRLIFAPGDTIALDDGTTLVINPEGFIVEQYTGSPAERALNEALGRQIPETRLRDLLAALELAADDEQIVQVLVRTDRLLGISPGMISELSQAFERFRQSGKPVVAYGSTLSQGTYALASLADELWLDPDGLLLIEGYSYFRNYFAEGLEKLKVDVNLFRVGEFKSAMEPFIRNDMSESDRAAAEFFIGGLWQHYLEIISGHRGMPVERLLDIVENAVDLLERADGDAAAMALEAGLVDRLMTRPAARLELGQRGTPDDRRGFRQIAMDEYLMVPRRPSPGRDQIGVIVAQGAITEGLQPPGTIGAESLSKLLREAASDDQIKAVVLRIDSGGGSAFASELIRQEMMAVRDAGKPVIVSMSNVAASGGYWIAMGADEIWAYPNTITGSIGIFGLLPTFQNSLDAIGVHTDGFGVAPLAGAFRVDRELPEAARRALQAIIEHGYSEFIGLVAEHRDLSVERVDQIAQGRVWTGSQARQRGLVDQLGTLEQAVAAAARIAGVGDDYETTYVMPRLSVLEKIFADVGAEAMARAGLQGIMPGMAYWPGRDLYMNVIEQFRRVSAGSARRNVPEVMAHCLCEAPM